MSDSGRVELLSGSFALYSSRPSRPSQPSRVAYQGRPSGLTSFLVSSGGQIVLSPTVRPRENKQIVNRGELRGNWFSTGNGLARERAGPKESTYLPSNSRGQRIRRLVQNHLCYKTRLMGSGLTI